MHGSARVKYWSGIQWMLVVEWMHILDCSLKNDTPRGPRPKMGDYLEGGHYFFKILEVFRKYFRHKITPKTTIFGIFLHFFAKSDIF